MKRELEFTELIEIEDHMNDAIDYIKRLPPVTGMQRNDLLEAVARVTLVLQNIEKTAK